MDKRKTTGNEGEPFDKLRAGSVDKTRNRSIGNYGEEIACKYLEARGYRVLERNLKLFCGEIDILAETPWKLGQKRAVVIVEVKTVTGSGYGGAVDLVRYRKQIKLRTLAKAISQDYPDRDLRIDVIGVDGNRINHIENAVN